MCHIYTPFKYLQGWWPHLFPGQPVPLFDNPFVEEISPTIWSKPPLVQAVAVSLCPIHANLKNRQLKKKFSKWNFSVRQAVIWKPHFTTISSFLAKQLLFITQSCTLLTSASSDCKAVKSCDRDFSFPYSALTAEQNFPTVLFTTILSFFTVLEINGFSLLFKEILNISHGWLLHYVGFY